MYPDLSYFFHDLLGTNVDNWTSIFKTFGLFLALTFLVSAFILSKEINRMEILGLVGKLKTKNTTTKTEDSNKAMIKDLVLNSLIAGFFVYKLPYIMDNFSAFKQNPAGILFSSGGNIILGILAAAAVAGLVYYSYKGDKSIRKLADIYC